MGKFLIAIAEARSATRSAEQVARQPSNPTWGSRDIREITGRFAMSAWECVFNRNPFGGRLKLDRFGGLFACAAPHVPNSQWFTQVDREFGQ